MFKARYGGSKRLLDRPAVLLLLCVLMTVPLWLPTIPPLVDLPGHMGRYRIMTAADAPNLARSFHFEWQLIGNLGVDLLMIPLSHVLDIETATKLVVILIAGGTSAAMLWLAREAHGQVPATALFALPLTYSFPFQFGFINFSFATALVFSALALWIRLGRQERFALRFAVFVPIGCIVWLVHTMGLGLLLLAAYASELVRLRVSGARWWSTLSGATLACVPLVLPTIVTLASQAEGNDMATGGWLNLAQKLTWIEGLLRENNRHGDLAAVAVLALLGLASLTLSRFRLIPLLMVPALACAATFIAMPFIVRGSAYADMRIAPVAAVLALLAIEVKEGSPRLTKFMVALGFLFLLVRLGGTTSHFAALDRRWQTELAALNHLPRGASVLVLVSRVCLGAWDTTRLDHLGDLATVRRDAFTNTAFAGDGAQLLKISRHDVGPYQRNPSQILVPLECSADGLASVTDIDAVLGNFNRAAFGYIWTIGVPERSVHKGLVVAWSSPSSTLYRVTGPSDITVVRPLNVSRN